MALRRRGGIKKVSGQALTFTLLVDHYVLLAVMVVFAFALFLFDRFNKLAMVLFLYF